LGSLPRRSAQVATAEKQIGARITAIRKRLGMPQVELATKLGMSQSLLSRYERGVLRLHGALVADLAKTLQSSTDEILGLKELKGNGASHDRRFVRRLQKIEMLSKRKKQALITTIDAFLKGESHS
jgi:transcriptional regulator with XRE-family HTH domain